MSRIVVRPVVDEDRDAIVDICLKTAYEGKSAAELLSIPELPALCWALPYITLSTGFGFVMVEEGEEVEGGSCLLEDESKKRGKIVGYIVGTSDTAAYEAAAEEHWWPTLRTVYPLPSVYPNAYTSDLTPLDKHYLSLIHAGTHAPADVLAFAGATVHIDILPAYQGRGWGRRLVHIAVTQLARRGARALWVGSNGEEGRMFYRKVGFRPIRDKFFGLRFEEFAPPHVPIAVSV